MNYTYLFKIVLAGNSNVGKSCLLDRFVSNTFKTEYLPTIGVQFGSKIFTLGDQTIKAQIWDCVSTSDHRCFFRSYYKMAVGLILPYDITRRSSFDQLPYQLNTIKEYAPATVRIVLVGTKSDLKECREVLEQQGRQFALANNLYFVQCSAKINHNVSEVFTELSELILEQIKTNQIDPAQSNGIKIGKLFKDLQKKPQRRICNT